MAKIQLLNTLLTISSFVGLGLSIYAYIVELAAQNNKNYVATCDINEHISCSKVVTSKYSKGLGFIHIILGEDSILNIPNPLVGITYYALSIISAQFTAEKLVRLAFYVNILACLSSMYFGSILVFVLRNFCLICVGTYIVNFINLKLHHMKLKAIVTGNARNERKKKH